MKRWINSLLYRVLQGALTSEIDAMRARVAALEARVGEALKHDKAYLTPQSERLYAIDRRMAALVERVAKVEGGK